MKTLFAIIFALLFVNNLTLAEDRLARRAINDYQNKRYELVVMQSELDDAPLWHDNEPNPPLSVRAAIASAREVVKKIPNSEDWKLSNVNLATAGNREGQWIYIVEFIPREKNTILVGAYTFKIPVLLNGKTPELKITR